MLRFGRSPSAPLQLSLRRFFAARPSPGPLGDDGEGRPAGGRRGGARRGKKKNPALSAERHHTTVPLRMHHTHALLGRGEEFATSEGYHAERVRPLMESLVGGKDRVLAHMRAMAFQFQTLTNLRKTRPPERRLLPRELARKMLSMAEQGEEISTIASAYRIPRDIAEVTHARRKRTLAMKSHLMIFNIFFIHLFLIGLWGTRRSCSIAHFGHADDWLYSI
jgi:hypothetical protein